MILTVQGQPDANPWILPILAESDPTLLLIRSVAGVQEDIDKLLASNNFMLELHSRIVPDIVESVDFWSRYFYR